jgi:hypothetical protein
MELAERALLFDYVPAGQVCFGADEVINGHRHRLWDSFANYHDESPSVWS